MRFADLECTVFRRALILLSLACSGQSHTTDAGVNNPEFRNPLEPLNTICKEWRDGQYYSVVDGRIVYFEYCVRW